MKNFYYAIVEKYGDKYYSYPEKVQGNLNIVRRWNNEKFLVVQPCHTKHEAEKLANYWNECYKNNGTLYEWK